MKLRTLLKKRQLRFSTYPNWSNWEKAKVVAEATADSLLDYHLVELSLPLDVNGVMHRIHLTLVAGSSAAMLRGADDTLLDIPILCRDPEAFCYELLEWRENAGLCAPKPPVLRGANLNAAMEAIIEEIAEDPFVANITDFTYHMEALSLIESLPRQ